MSSSVLCLICFHSRLSGWAVGEGFGQGNFQGDDVPHMVFSGCGFSNVDLDACHS